MVRWGAVRSLPQGAYVTLIKEVKIRGNGTSLRIAAGSTGRIVRSAANGSEEIVLLGNWHIRIPRKAVAVERLSDEPLPYPWTNQIDRTARRWRSAEELDEDEFWLDRQSPPDASE